MVLFYRMIAKRIVFKVIGERFGSQIYFNYQVLCMRDSRSEDLVCLDNFSNYGYFREKKIIIKFSFCSLIKDGFSNPIFKFYN